MLIRGMLLRTKEEEWTDSNGVIQTFISTNLLSGDDVYKATCEKTKTSLATWQSLEGADVQMTATLSVNRAGVVKVRLSDPTPLSSPARSSASSGQASAS